MHLFLPIHDLLLPVVVASGWDVELVDVFRGTVAHLAVLLQTARVQKFDCVFLLPVVNDTFYFLNGFGRAAIVSVSSQVFVVDAVDQFDGWSDGMEAVNFGALVKWG